MRQGGELLPQRCFVQGWCKQGAFSIMHVLPALVLRSPNTASLKIQYLLYSQGQGLMLADGSAVEGTAAQFSTSSKLMAFSGSPFANGSLPWPSARFCACSLCIPNLPTEPDTDHEALPILFWHANAGKGKQPCRWRFTALRLW